MHAILKWSLKNKLVVLLMTLLVLGAGWAAAAGIQLEKYPDVEMPALVLQMKYPNHTAEEVERDITVPVEKAIGNLRPYDSLTSQSREHGAVITVAYEFGTDMDKMEQSIQTAIRSAGLPGEAEAVYKRISADAKPVYRVALASANNGELETSAQAGLLPEVKQVPGVSTAELGGTTEQRLRIAVDKQKAALYGVTLQDIKSAIEQSQYILPLGTMEEPDGSIAVAMEDQLEGANGLENVPVSVKLAGAKASAVRLGELARVEQLSSSTAITRYNGQEALLLTVYKTQDSNTAEVVSQVRELVEQFRQESGGQLYPLVDQGRDVEDSVAAMLREGGFGALFTIVVILVFLRNVRATLIAVISLPVSILGTLYILNAFGYSLNIMTLGGIAVAVGRIVDDSIVVIENIFRRLRLEPEEDKGRLMLRAAAEVAGPVASSTAATVVIFLPLTFVDGIVGEFFRPFSVAVVTSILLSLAVAFLLIPVLAASVFRTGVKEKEGKGLDTVYAKLLSLALSRRWMVLLTAVLLLAGSGWMMKSIGKSFLPTEKAQALAVDVNLPEKVSREKTDLFSKRLEERFAGEKQITSVQASIGGTGEVRAMGADPSADNQAEYQLKLAEEADLTEMAAKLKSAVEEELTSAYPEGTVRIRELRQDGPPSGNTVDVTLYGSNQEELRAASEQVKRLMSGSPLLHNVTGGAQELQAKYTVAVTDEARMKGVSPYGVYQQAREQFQPLALRNIKLGGQVTEAELGYDRMVGSKQDLTDLKVLTPSLGQVRLGDIARVEESAAPLSVQHHQGMEAVKLSAESGGEEVGQATKQLKQDMALLPLPKSIQWEIGGGQKLMASGFRDLGLAMAAAIGLVFVVLSIAFGGLLVPVVILASLIFIPFGSLGALLASGQSLSMSGMIGMLMLIGIVVTNAVVLLERIESNRKRGMALLPAVKEAGSVRLRPILMTALATVFALLPLAMSDSGSGVISKGLAISVIGGLGVSTLLTLFFVPVLYSMTGRWRRFPHE